MEQSSIKVTGSTKHSNWLKGRLDLYEESLPFEQALMIFYGDMPRNDVSKHFDYLRDLYFDFQEVFKQDLLDDEDQDENQILDRYLKYMKDVYNYINEPSNNKLSNSQIKPIFLKFIQKLITVQNLSEAGDLIYDQIEQNNQKWIEYRKKQGSKEQNEFFQKQSYQEMKQEVLQIADQLLFIDVNNIEESIYQSVLCKKPFSKEFNYLYDYPIFKKSFIYMDGIVLPFIFPELHRKLLYQTQEPEKILNYLVTIKNQRQQKQLLEIFHQLRLYFALILLALECHLKNDNKQYIQKLFSKIQSVIEESTYEEFYEFWCKQIQKMLDLSSQTSDTNSIQGQRGTIQNEKNLNEIQLNFQNINIQNQQKMLSQQSIETQQLRCDEELKIDIQNEKQSFISEGLFFQRFDQIEKFEKNKQNKKMKKAKLLSQKLDKNE